MKKLFLLAMAVVGLNSCQNDEVTADSSFAMKASGADYDVCDKAVVTVNADITTNTTWTSNTVWELDGVIRVKNGATLTIQAGTFIKAKPKTGNVATGVLVITKTGTINAMGTALAPIVFTSYKLLDCVTSTPAPGDFGGVILLGSAQVNTGVATNIIEGLGDQPNSSELQFGGTDTSGNALSAGTMQYVRIEYAGRKLPTEGDNGVEINGLTFGGVGSGTVINHIQVSWGLDDAFEFFGGTVNATHLVAFSNDDDSFDFDWGYKGSITKAISIANKNSTHSTSSGSPDSNGIELDNNATGTAGTPATLITRPVIRQLSIVGFKDGASALTGLENGIHVRRLGQIDIEDATVTGYTTGLRWDAPSLASNSSWAVLSIHGFTVASTSALGPGNTATVSATAPIWGAAPYQPFYNETSPSAFSILSGTTGAFATEPNWTATWTSL